ncbi:MAG: DegT/DnrJ/EryC1/StrS family aminotransferase [Spirochaetes bacterium]|nr:DegT/DnrJ/EryC1/StrS family aminotransferase [Spirochaetota bacterium]
MPTKNRLELAADSWDHREVRALNEVIRSRRFTMGPKVLAFEQAFAKKIGRKYAVMSNSGSSANLIGIASYFFRKKRPLQAGDEVIVPCVSWATTYYPLHQYGLKLRFVDVDLETLNYHLPSLERAITRKTRMIAAVSILGNPCEFDPILALCKKHGLYLFEDNCESLGARYRGKPTGTFGDVSTFSTFFSHHISTMEGGLTCTDDFETYCLLRSLRNHGWTRDQDPGSPIFKKRPRDFFEAYRFILPGYNVRPGELQGAVGLVQLKKLDHFVAVRRKNAAHFQALFAGHPTFIIQREIGESSWFAFTFIVRPELPFSRERALPHLKRAGIHYRVVTGGNFLRHDVAKYVDLVDTGSKNADLVHDRGFFVGNHPFDIRREIDLLHKALSKV